MNKKRGRLWSLLARMKGATREEIINTIKHGTPAWRIIRLRQLINDERERLRGDGKQLLPNALSQGLRAIEAHVITSRAHGVLWNEFRAKNKGKPPAQRLKARDELRARLPKLTPLPDKTWNKAACLWRELSMQIESALVIGDDDWLDELAKAIRGQASPEQNAQFTAKVLDRLQKIGGAPTNDIFNSLENARCGFAKASRKSNA